jgi:hypothetical protein
MRNVCYEREIPSPRFVVAFMTLGYGKCLPAYSLPAVVFFFLVPEGENVRMREFKVKKKCFFFFFIYDSKNENETQSEARKKKGELCKVFLLFIKESYYAVIYAVSLLFMSDKDVSCRVEAKMSERDKRARFCAR